MMTKEVKCKEEDENTKLAPNQQHQLDSKPLNVPNLNMVIIPPQNQVINAVGNKYYFMDSSGNPVSSVLQIPTPSPTGQIPIQQGTSAGVQFLMLNPNLDLSSFSNPFASADGKGLSVTKSTQNPNVLLPIISPTDEVIYVNHKQYDRILIRRKQRLKLQQQGKIPSNGERKKYLHESRHLHATNRCRESGGRFGGSPTQE